jgi:CheY-like chemotaxis protein
MPKILIVDDVKAFLDLEVSFLKRAECEIISAMDGLEALKQAKREKPDLIFLDIEMPKMTGIEVLRIIRNDPELKNTPVVIVTALENKEEEALKAGATEFLKKPVYEKDILYMVKKYVGIPERREERIAVSLPVRVKTEKKVIDGFTRDLSLVGAFVIIRESIPLGTEVEIEMEIPSEVKETRMEKIKITGEVVREEKEEIKGQVIKGVGIAFKRISGLGKKILAEFIKKKLS